MNPTLPLNCENPLRPLSEKTVLSFSGVCVALLLGWWIMENQLGFQLTTRSQAAASAVGSAVAGHTHGREPVSFTMIGIGVVVVGLAALLLTWRNRHLVQNGQRAVASVVKAKTLQGVRVVTLTYTLNGKAQTRKLDLHGSWAEDLAPPQMVEIIATNGLFACVHVLGRTTTRVQPLAPVPQNTTIGGGELIDALNEGKVKLESVNPTVLPEDLRQLNPEQFKASVAKQAAERDVIEDRIAELLKKRHLAKR